MRFSNAYSRPSLTPLGQRLLNLSERKLYDLDAPIGTRESGTALLKSVLVRETVRVAWTAVDGGHQAPALLSDWASPNAMGLDIIGEDEEENEEVWEEKQEKWFEDLLAELGEQEEQELEWSMEGGKVFVTERPRAPATSPVLVPADITHLDSATTEVEVIEVDGLAPDLPVTSDETVPLSSIERLDAEEDFTPLSRTDSLSPPLSFPITPVDLHPLLGVLGDLEDIDECDDFALPPLLHRSWSSDSTASAEDDECLTPTMTCEDLEDVSSFKWDYKDDSEDEEVEVYAGGSAMAIGKGFSSGLSPVRLRERPSFRGF